MGRGGTWGAGGVRERTSVSLWRKPLRWARLAEEGLLPDGVTPHGGRRPRVFCASLADVFEPRPELGQWRHDLFDLIAATPGLDWLVLTKRPEFARDWLHSWYDDHSRLSGTLFGPREWTSRGGIGWGVLPNLWMGTSIENARFTWRADVLRDIPAAVRFLSCEPLLGSLFDTGREGDKRARGGSDAPRASDGLKATYPSRRVPDSRPLGRSASAENRRPDGAIEGGTDTRGRAPLDLTGIDWVIVGGESGGRDSRPMHLEWARELRDACVAYRCLACGASFSLPLGTSCPGHDPRRGPAFHMKQWGSHDAEGVYRGPSPTAGGPLLDGAEWREFPRAAV